jgi:hypothetical protein
VAEWIAVGADGAAWVVVLVLLTLDLLGVRRLRAGRRWQACGIVLALAGVLAGGAAEARGWSGGGLRAAHLVLLPCVLTGIIVLAAGLVIQLRARPAGGADHAA